MGRFGVAPFPGALFFNLIFGGNLGFANVGDNFLGQLFVIRVLGGKSGCTDGGELVRVRVRVRVRVITFISLVNYLSENFMFL